MKRAVALILSIIIMVFSLCSCGGKLPGKNNTELTAKNFTNLADDDGYLYAFGGKFDLSVLWYDSMSNILRIRGANEDFSFDRKKLAEAAAWNLTIYNDQQFSFDLSPYENYQREPWPFTLLYSDPDGQYVIFADEENRTERGFFSHYQVTFAGKQLMQSILNKYFQNEMQNQRDTLTLEQWVSFVDSCK